MNNNNSLKIYIGEDEAKMIFGEDMKKEAKGQIDSLISGLGSIIDLVGDMIEKGENVKNINGEVNIPSEKRMKANYGVSMRFGINDSSELEKDFIKRTNIQVKTEPNIDVYDEENEYIVIVLVNNIEEDDIQILKKQNKIIFEARNPYVYYSKQIEIPSTYKVENLKWNYKNGIVKIVIPDGEWGIRYG